MTAGRPLPLARQAFWFARRPATGNAAVMVALMRGILLILLVGWWAGCSRSDPLDETVKSQTVLAFAMWKSKTAQQFDQEVWRAFEDACAELKLSLMIRQVASGSDAVDTAFRSAIDGRPMRDVIHEGLSKRLERLQAQKGELDKMMTANQRLRTNPDDVASKEYLLGIRSNQEQRLAKLKEEIETVTRQLALLTPPSGR